METTNATVVEGTVVEKKENFFVKHKKAFAIGGGIAAALVGGAVAYNVGKKNGASSVEPEIMYLPAPTVEPSLDDVNATEF